MLNDIQLFGQRVERMCEFLLERVKDPEERETIIKIKDKAADLQVNPDRDLFKGLSNHIRGLTEVKKET